MEFAVLVFIAVMVVIIYGLVLDGVKHLKDIKDQNEVMCQFLRDMNERDSR